MSTGTDREHGPLQERVPAAKGFAPRRRAQVLADRAWHDTVTHYTPEPWLIALGRERNGLPLRRGPRREANR